MNKKMILKAILDGFVESLTLICLGLFLVSTYALNLTLNHGLWLGFLGAVICVVVFALLIRKETSNKVIILYFLINIFSFILCYAIMMSIRMVSEFEIFSLRDVNNGDGILLLFVNGCFVLSSLVLRVCVLVVLAIKNKVRSRK